MIAIFGQKLYTGKRNQAVHGGNLTLDGRVCGRSVFGRSAVEPK